MLPSLPVNDKWRPKTALADSLIHCRTSRYPTGTSETFAALSKRVYPLKKVKCTSPVGPFLCLAINRFTGIAS